MGSRRQWKGAGRSRACVAASSARSRFGNGAAPRASKRPLASKTKVARRTFSRIDRGSAAARAAPMSSRRDAR
jgi:hypothetical protein